MTVVRIPGGILPEHTKWIDDQKLSFGYQWGYEYSGYNIRNLSGGTDFVKTGLIGVHLPDDYAVLFKLKFSL